MATKYFTHTNMMYNGINGKQTHTKRKTLEACISENKVHWTKGQCRYLLPIYLPLIPFLLKSLTYV
jgi:hypothetical protein